MQEKVVVAAALGECVHVAGISNFLRLAEAAGWRTVFLGPAVSIAGVLESARKEKADLVGVSYRLTPETGERLLGQFAEEAAQLQAQGVRFVFGGTPPVAERALRLGFFERVFDGRQAPEEVLAFLKGQSGPGASVEDYPQTMLERIRWKLPYPLLRHHFGLPSMAASLRGIEQIAEAKAVDVISLGIDQEAQEHFFHPERQEARRTGAGGVPVRSAEDYRALYAASRRGNFPLLRTYSGTDDFVRLAEMYVQTIQIAWGAVPLFWFNRMDGRGAWDLEGSIREHQRLMAWYGAQDLPVELNEPHHWAMRDAPDVIFVATAFLSAYNAKASGVRDYIAALMFNSPPGLSDAMDLAKMLAALEIVTELTHDPNLTPGPSTLPGTRPASGRGGRKEREFRIWKQTRTGLLSYPLDPAAARGHLAASIYLQMALKPEIVHIVGPSEADHAATAEDVIEASEMARRAIENAVRGAPDMTADPAVQRRKEELMAEARLTLGAMRDRAAPGVEDPWTDAASLAKAVTSGILDAPQLKNNPFGRGKIRTQIVDSMCLAVDPDGRPLGEAARLAALEKEQI
ncbi:MAG: cobalamin-dependent protein [Anaerolineales bacterium]